MRQKRVYRKRPNPRFGKNRKKPTQEEGAAITKNTGDPKDKEGALVPKISGDKKDKSGTLVPDKELPAPSDPSQRSKEKTQTTGKRTRDAERNEKKTSELYEKPPKKRKSSPTPRRDDKCTAKESNPKKSKKEKPKGTDRRQRDHKPTQSTTKKDRKRKRDKADKRKARERDPPLLKYRLTSRNRILTK